MNEDQGTAGSNAMNEREIGERLALIESMMREGRKSTEYWGWNFLLWGIAYFVATAWSSFLPHGGGALLAWPISMIFAVLLTVAIARRRMRHTPRTEMSRALQAIWSAMGFGIFVFAFPVAFSGHFQMQSFLAAIEVMLGIAHIASGSMTRWTMQIVVGILWWVAAVASCFVDATGVAYTFLAATLVCNIGFGIYLMIRESRSKARAGEVQHA